MLFREDAEASTRQELYKLCGFSPVRSCVVAYRLRLLGSADSHSVDIASLKKVINLFYLALPVIRVRLGIVWA